MSGFVIIDTEVVDPEAYSEYVEKSLGVIAAHGGRLLVRTSQAESVHGGWAPKRLVILQFYSRDAARRFIDSAEYRALDDLRQRAAHSRTVLVAESDPEA